MIEYDVGKTEDSYDYGRKNNDGEDDNDSNLLCIYSQYSLHSLTYW